MITIFKDWDNWDKKKSGKALVLISTILTIVTSLITFLSFRQCESSNVQPSIDSTSLKKTNLYIQDSVIKFINRSERAIEFNRTRRTRFDTFDKINYTIPIVRYPKNIIIETKINSVIKEKLGSLDNCKSDLGGGYINMRYDVEFQNKNILSLRVRNVYHELGMANELVDETILNFNLLDGSSFKLRDIFDSLKLDSLRILLAKKLHEHECPCIFDESEFMHFDYLDLDYGFNEKSITFIFPKYFVACGACDVVNVNLNFSEIVGLIDPKGPLLFIYDNSY